jgi:uncharacterized damage-inducible protein DinB
MKSDPMVIKKAIGNALTGKSAHTATQKIFEGLDWEQAGGRPAGAPHSVYQLLRHMAFWQDWVVTWLDGGNPPVPKHAAGSWEENPAPASKEEWERAVKSFCAGLAGLERRSRQKDLLAKRGKHTRLGMLQAIAAHNSYHAGEVVLLRQMLGAWPPPSGGLTW